MVTMVAWLAFAFIMSGIALSLLVHGTEKGLGWLPKRWVFWLAGYSKEGVPPDRDG